MACHHFLRDIAGEIFVYKLDSLLDSMLVSGMLNLVLLMLKAFENKEGEDLIESAFYQHLTYRLAVEFSRFKALQHIEKVEHSLDILLVLEGAIPMQKNLFKLCENVLVDNSLVELYVDNYHRVIGRILELVEVVWHTKVSRAALEGDAHIVEHVRALAAEDELKFAVGMPVKHDRLAPVTDDVPLYTKVVLRVADTGSGYGIH